MRQTPSITLLDGRIIPCYESKSSEHPVSNQLQMDTTGTSFQIGRYSGTRQSNTTSSPIEVDAEVRKKLFLTHCHFLVSHSEQIFSDSRMFFAPIPIASGLAISGHVKQVTLGIFIEWLLHYPPSTQTDNRDKVWLVCRLSGSGLSNRNLCTLVDSRGNTKKEYIPDFYKAFRTLVNIKNRYKNVVNLSQSYTIEQVIYRLKYPMLIRYFWDIFHKKRL